MKYQWVDQYCLSNMNKEHWNSVYVDGDVPDDVLKQMIDISYELVFKSLTKKVQKEIN